jgi:polysaccharide export outer membrane protein
MNTTNKTIPGMDNMSSCSYAARGMGVGSIRIVFLMTCCFALFGCERGRSGEAVYADAARSDPRGRPFVIGVADVVRVTVWKDPNLSGEVAVLPDGTITLPLVGEIHAAGTTAAALKQTISERLAAFSKDPVQVTVAIVDVNSYRFTVAGNVEHPGMFTSKYFVTVSQAIALAGGPNRYGETSNVVLVRDGHRIPIDYGAVLSGTRADEDIVVLAGDAIRVP